MEPVWLTKYRSFCDSVDVALDITLRLLIKLLAVTVVAWLLFWHDSTLFSLPGLFRVPPAHTEMKILNNSRSLSSRPQNKKPKTDDPKTNHSQ